MPCGNYRTISKINPFSFYPWLRRIAWERLLNVHNQHIEVQKRSVERERRKQMSLSGESVMHLASRLAEDGPSPSAYASSKEQVERVRIALEHLAEQDREVLVLRYLEHLSTNEIAEIMGTSNNNVKIKHFRAIRRLQKLLNFQ